MEEYLREDKDREGVLKQQLEDQIAADGSSNIWTLDNLTEQLEAIKSVWPKISDEHAKREFIHRLFSSITIDNDQNAGRYNIRPVITQVVPK
jgi:hypothetical protein